MSDLMINRRDVLSMIRQLPSEEPARALLYIGVEQLPPVELTAGGNLINRQAALDALGEAPEVWTDSPEEFAALHQWEMDVTAIEAVPSAEPKTGRWVGIKEYCDHMNEEAAKKGESTRYMPSGMYIGVYCDQCWEVNERSAAYCPNCGAPMEKELDGGYYG